MHAYRIEYDSTHYIVIASNFTEAIAAWTEHVKAEWGADYVGDEQPESVAKIWGHVIPSKVIDP